MDPQADIKEQKAKFKAKKAEVDDQKSKIMVFRGRVDHIVTRMKEREKQIKP